MTKNFNLKILSFSVAIFCGLVMFFLILAGIYLDYAPLFFVLVEQIYPGFTLSITGLFVGAIYAFLDGFIATYIIGWLYLQLLKLLAT
ncbi:MAG TPA: hypothetical protein ENN31_00180 [Candidatus Vogelbacteria bacterium]|nr:hypothetical protein [Candidatus Vogelbacteria bacterium]